MIIHYGLPLLILLIVLLIGWLLIKVLSDDCE